MRRLCALFLSLALCMPCFVLTGDASEEGTVLYHRTPAATWEDTLSFWPSNTTQGWRSTCTTAEFGTQPSVEYYNNTGSGGGLPAGETLYIDLADVSVPTDGHGHLALSLQYAQNTLSSDMHVGQIGRFEVRVSCDGGQSWSEGAAGLARHELTSVGTISAKRDVLVFQVTSTDLACLVPEGAVIDRIRIRPFGDHPVHYGAFRVQWIDVTGYAEAQDVPAPDVPPEPDPIPMDEELMRAIVVDRMYRIVDLPWRPYSEIVTYNSNTTVDVPEGYIQYYKPGYLYRGPAYSRIIDSTWQMFRASVDEALDYHGGDTNDTVIGMDCIKIVSNALVTVSNARHDTWIFAPMDPRLPLLGGIEDPAGTGVTNEIVSQLGDQAVCRGYAELRPGDYVLCHPDQAGHVRLCTGPTHTVYDDAGDIDPRQSTVTVTETRGFIEYLWQKPDGEIVKSIEKDLDAYQAAHPDYVYLSGSSCRKDRVMTFAELLDQGYLAWTLEEYALGQVRGLGLQGKLTCGPEALSEQGLRLLLDCTWPMIAVDTALTDADTGQVLWREYRYLPTGQYQYLYRNDALDAALAALEPGSYAVTADVTAGPVTEIGGEPPVTRAMEEAFRVAAPGDLNADGKVNGKDAVALQRFLAGGYGVTLDASAADLNGDGKQNGKDAVLLQRFLAGGYGVTLG